jgi:hypothetical protein
MESDFFIEQRSLIHRGSHNFQETDLALFAVREMMRQTLRCSFACLAGRSPVAAESRCAIREQKKGEVSYSGFEFQISDYYPGRCHSLLIAPVTHRAVWLKAYWIARIERLPFTKLN